MIQYNYDEESDVMYISFGKPKPCISKHADDVLLRYNKKKLNGITIVNYSLVTTDKRKKK